MQSASGHCTTGSHYLGCLRITTRMSPTSGRGSGSPGAMTIDQWKISLLCKTLAKTGFVVSQQMDAHPSGKSRQAGLVSSLGLAAETAYRQGLRRSKIEKTAFQRVQELSLPFASVGHDRADEPRVRDGSCIEDVSTCERGLAVVE